VSRYTDTLYTYCQYTMAARKSKQKHTKAAASRKRYTQKAQKAKPALKKAAKKATRSSSKTKRVVRSVGKKANKAPARAKKAVSNKGVPRTAAKPQALKERARSHAAAGKAEDDVEAKTGQILTKGRERGYVTYDEILKAFPKIEEDIVFLEELYEKLNAASIDVLEGGNILSDDPIEELLDLSMNQTLSRTILTGITTLLALSGLYWFGGEVISSFTLAMIFGILIGTYSSVFVAGPLLILFKLRPESFEAGTGEMEAKTPAHASKA
jgi:hypothetical protein